MSNQNNYIYLTFEAARVRQIVLQYSRDTGTHVCTLMGLSLYYLQHMFEIHNRKSNKTS